MCCDVQRTGNEDVKMLHGCETWSLAVRKESGNQTAGHRGRDWETEMRCVICTAG